MFVSYPCPAHPTESGTVHRGGAGPLWQKEVACSLVPPWIEPVADQQLQYFWMLEATMEISSEVSGEGKPVLDEI